MMMMNGSRGLFVMVAFEESWEELEDNMSIALGMIGVVVGK